MKKVSTGSSKAATRRREMLKSRNWLAVNAFQRSGAGRHKDRRKEASKRACRGKVGRHQVGE
jgi:hypothetical protein